MTKTSVLPIWDRITDKIGGDGFDRQLSMLVASCHCRPTETLVGLTRHMNKAQNEVVYYTHEVWALLNYVGVVQHCGYWLVSNRALRMAGFGDVDV